MASTLTRILVYIVFSTKHREAMIASDDEPDLYAYVGGICRGTGCPLPAMGGTCDHVHLRVSLSKTAALADLLLNIKHDSSR